MDRVLRIVLACVCVVIGSAPSAAAAFAAGSVIGTVTDAEGARLADVEVVLEGTGRRVETRTDAEGRFRFAPLDPGRYVLTAHRAGFLTASAEAVDVRMGRATTARIRLGYGSDDAVIVLSEPPRPAVEVDHGALDVESVGTVPPALDPWAPVEGVRAMPARPADALDDGEVGDGTRPLVTALTEAPPARRVELDLGYSDRSWRPARSGESVDRTAPDIERLLDVASWGLEGSGGLWDDRLWLWGNYRGEDVERAVVGGQTVHERFDHAGIRAQIQPWTRTSLVVDYSDTSRSRDGADAGPTRAPEATRLELEPASRAEIELTQMLDADSFVSVQAVHHDAALSLLPTSEGAIVLDADGVWRGASEIRSREDLFGLRTEVHASRRNRLGLHELRLGLEHRRIEDDRSERWGDGASVLLSGEGFGTPFDLLRLKRDGDIVVERETSAFWLQDRLELSARGDWTVGLGVRVDVQKGRSLGGRREANPLFPDLLPEAEHDGARQLDWRDLSPRLSLARAFGEHRRTILRAGFGSFASSLADDLVLRTSPVGNAEVIVGFTDLDDDLRLGKREPYELLETVNVARKAQDTGLYSADELLRAERTDELRIGLELHPTRALELRFDAVGRRTTSVLESRRVVHDPETGERLARADDYVLETILTGLLPDGSPYAAPVYGLRDGLVATGGALLVNGDRQRRFEGVEVLVNKRLSNGWMFRARGSWGDWRWHLGPEFLAHDDPTDAGPSRGEIDATDNQGAPASEDPAQYVTSRWSFDVLMLYEVARNQRWGFDLSAHVHGREGYPLPYVASYASDDGVRDVQVVDTVDSYRLDDVVSLDFRLSKSLRLGSVRTTLALDALNVFDSSHVLERETRLGAPTTDLVQRTTSARALQLGLRLSM